MRSGGFFGGRAWAVENRAPLSRRLRTTLRNEAAGVTWSVSPHGAQSRVEIAFDDDPEPVTRTIPRAEQDALVAAQLASGFVRVPPWEPTPEWIRDAPDAELWAEVLDGWIMATLLEWRRVEAAPPAVRAWLTLDGLAGQCSRNGLAMYFMDCDPALVAHTPEAARALGLESLAAQFESVAKGTTRTPGRVKLGSPKAAKALETFAMTELPALLMAWVRRHAEAFVPVPPDASAG